MNKAANLIFGMPTLAWFRYARPARLFIRLTADISQFAAAMQRATESFERFIKEFNA